MPGYDGHELPLYIIYKGSQDSRGTMYVPPNETLTSSVCVCVCTQETEPEMQRGTLRRGWPRHMSCHVTN